MTHMHVYRMQGTEVEKDRQDKWAHIVSDVNPQPQPLNPTP